MGRFVNSHDKKQHKSVTVDAVEPVDENQDFEGVLVGNGLYREVTLHLEDAGKSVDVKHFGEVIVSLPEVIAENHKWLVKDVGSMKLFDESKKTVEQDVAQERIFRLEPQELGQSTISFQYINPWKANEGAKNSVEFTVVVK